MLCRECEYFHIRQEPIRCNGLLFDAGLAVCEKHNMSVNFINHGKFNRLKCVDELKEGGDNHEM